MRTAAVALGLPALGAAWAVWSSGHPPGSWVDLAAGICVLGAATLEGAIARRLWTGTMSSAHPVRLGLYLAVAVVGGAALWRAIEAWPFGAPRLDLEYAMGVVEAIEARRVPLALHAVTAAAAAFGLGYGLREAAAQAWGLAFAAAGGAKRRRAKSNLHGDARWMTVGEVLRMGRRGAPNNVVLGQVSRFGKQPLVTYRLEGSAITFAPPRTGKTALIIQNLLDPGERAWRGSTVIVDPRGNVFAATARARRGLGRTVRLLDPFGVVAGHKRAYGSRVHLPYAESERYNPLDLVRDGDHHSSDIRALLEAFLKSPKGGGQGQHSEHFHQLSGNLLTGAISWVSKVYERDVRNLSSALEICRADMERIEELESNVGAAGAKAGEHIRETLKTLKRLGSGDEGTSASTTLLNQMAWIGNEFMRPNIEDSTFDPVELADGNTDLYVVVPQEDFEIAAPWIRFWMAMPAMIAARRPLKAHILVYLDEMAALGYLEPVVRSYTMAAGSGVHYWCFAQTISALDQSYGREARQMIVQNAEVVQVLGFPRYGVEMAKEFAEAIGHATWHGRQESQSDGESTGGKGGTSVSGRVNVSDNLVKELLVSPEDLLRLEEGRQVAITGTREVARNAAMFDHARYWMRDDCFPLWDPDPMEVAKAMEAGDD